MPLYRLTINGDSYAVEAEADMPLLWVLRDLLALTGTKYSCGIGQCGACTIQLDNKAVRSCMLPVSSIGTRHITTIEGLSNNDEHPLFEAWLTEQVSQCGYCQPGQIMSAAALLQANPNPTDAEINRAMAGNLCRCGTYQRIRRAIQRVAHDSGKQG